MPNDPESPAQDPQPEEPDCPCCEVFIYDVIQSATDFIYAINCCNGADLHIRINSPGGSVFDALAMYSYLKSYSGKVTVTVDGIAASAASFLMLCGKVRNIVKGGFVMIHNPWSMPAGDSSVLRKEADLLDNIAEQLVRLYSTYLKCKPEEIKSMMEQETWLGSDKAVALGFATNEIDGAPVLAVVNGEKFKNAPAPVAAANKSAEGIFDKIASIFKPKPQDAKITDLENANVILTKKIADLENKLTEQAKLIKTQEETIDDLEDTVEEFEKIPGGAPIKQDATPDTSSNTNYTETFNKLRGNAKAAYAQKFFKELMREAKE